MLMPNDYDPRRDVSLTRFLRESEVMSLRKRQAFMIAIEVLKQKVQTEGLVWRELSEACGYEPDTLSSVFSDSMVFTQERYNFRALCLAMDHVGLNPPDILSDK